MAGVRQPRPGQLVDGPSLPVCSLRAGAGDHQLLAGRPGPAAAAAGSRCMASIERGGHQRPARRDARPLACGPGDGRPGRGRSGRRAWRGRCSTMAAVSAACCSSCLPARPLMQRCRRSRMPRACSVSSSARPGREPAQVAALHHRREVGVAPAAGRGAGVAEQVGDVVGRTRGPCRRRRRPGRWSARSPTRRPRGRRRRYSCRRVWLAHR